MKVKTASDLSLYVTSGKEYDVIENCDFGFSITDDEDDVIVCIFEKCPHIGGMDWEIVEEES